MNIILEYFFSPLPAGKFKYMGVLIAIAVIFLLGSIALRVILKKRKEDKMLRKFFKELPGQLQTIAICEGFYVLSRYLKIPFLSIRFLNYIILASALFVVAKNVQMYLKDYPEAQKIHAEQIKMNKYLPRKKH